MNVIKKIVLFPVYLYRRFISPLSEPCCRFTPTCSQYCIDAVNEWGVIRGLGLALWRVLRCNPWSAGGYDPVPKNPKRRKQN